MTKTASTKKNNPPKTPSKKGQRKSLSSKKTSTKKAILYIEGVGRRKTSTARVRIFPKEKSSFIINDKDYREYFPIPELQKIVLFPLSLLEMEQKFKVSVKVKGGGVRGQAEAIRLGLARALVKMNSDLRKPLKKAGYLKRDARARERKKFGLKRARKAPQWQKR